MRVHATSLVTGAGIALTSDDQRITIMLKPGQTHEVSDKMRHAQSIINAINAGLITVEMDSSESSDFVAQVELTGGVGSSGYSGYSGASGRSGYSGVSGQQGDAGSTGLSGTSGYSGVSGQQGDTGLSGTSGYSGISGQQGDAGSTGLSGTSGYSGVSGQQGDAGSSGTSGYSGLSGQSGTAGGDGTSGYSGFSGFSGAGTSGYSGFSGAGVSGFAGSLAYVINGAGSPITTGVKGDLRIPFSCTVTGWNLLADQSGDIVVDIWKDTEGNYPPTDADSITGISPPTLSSAAFADSQNLTGWGTTSIAAQDILRFNVDSVSTVTRVTIQLDFLRD